MAHNPLIPVTPTCTHENIFEYWHENDKCGLEDCAVNECEDCGEYATECELDCEKCPQDGCDCDYALEDKDGDPVPFRDADGVMRVQDGEPWVIENE